MHENRSTARGRFLRIAGESGVAVVCSQGGVIPDLVARLAHASGFPLRAAPSDKGSVWTLTFRSSPSTDDGVGSLELVAADYLPDARA